MKYCLCDEKYENVNLHSCKYNNIILIKIILCKDL